MSADKDYEVGYGRPPKHTRFRPGQSGNPKGRPKGTKNLATDVSEELAERIMVSEGGKTRALTKQRAVIKTLTAKALKGDARAIQLLLRHGLYSEQARDDHPDTQALKEEDRAILADFVARQRAQQTER